MPKFTDSDTPQLQSHTAGHFGFTAVNLDDLEASGYTLATIACDRSGSTRGFQQPMEAALKAAIESLKPIGEEVMVRVLAFDSTCEEIHGFVPLADIDPSRYDGILNPRGMTALFDACINGAEAAAEYGRQLLADHFKANGILIVITDGMNNSGKFPAETFPNNRDVPRVAEAFSLPQHKECLESFQTILIAVNVQDSGVKPILESFHKEAGFSTDLIALNDASPETISKIGKFISASVSSTSQALGSNAPSQNLTWGTV
jgi:uncharacterized protein YegL